MTVLHDTEKSKEPAAAAHAPAGRVLLAFAAVLYFSEGFPFGLVTELLPLYLRLTGASLATIGLLSTISFAWTAKVLWSPLVDVAGTYRVWITAAVTALATGFAALAFVAPGSVSFWIVVAAIALASATQDIAVDAFAAASTPRPLLGAVNSIRIAGYRVAMIAAGGGLALVASAYGWRAAFICAAVVATALAVASIFVPDVRGHVTAQSFLSGFTNWLRRSDALAIFGVVLLYRLGDNTLTPMIKPFWVDRGYSAAEIGSVTTILGMSMTIAGAAVAGIYIAKRGIWRALAVFGVLQMLSNAGYALAATFDGARPMLYGATIIENLCGGMGTAAFLAFIMSVCDRERAATENALLTAAFGFARSLAGSASGFGAEELGYAPFFWVTLFLGVPGLLLLPFVRKTETRTLSS
ncbi:MAG: MFS transporter [Thermoanaerobaculia bacterium]